MRPWIGLAARGNVRVAGERLYRIASLERRHKCAERAVLRRFESSRVTALQFDADREIIAALAAEKTRRAGVPRALVAGHELLERAVAMDHEVRRHPHAAQMRVVV